VQLAKQLADEGWTMIAMAQSAQAMSASTSEMLRLVASGQFRHGGTGIMRWQAGNVVTSVNPVGNIRLDRQHAADKVDGMVAAVMGLDRALRRSALASSYLAMGF
jgi:phage terminase large subunit-like protein